MSSNVRKIAYGNGVFVALGGGGSINIPPVTQTSVDGINWTLRTCVVNEIIRDLKFLNGQFFACGDSAASFGVSTDGINWILRTSGFGTTAVKSISYGNNLYTLSGLGSQLSTSTDAIVWTSRTSGTTSVLDLQYYNSLYFGYGTTNPSTTTILSYSTDAIVWAQPPSVANTANFRQLFTLSYGNGLYVAGGGLTSSASTIISASAETTSIAFNGGNGTRGGGGGGGDNSNFSFKE